MVSFLNGICGLLFGPAQSSRSLAEYGGYLSLAEDSCQTSVNLATNLVFCRDKEIKWKWMFGSFIYTVLVKIIFKRLI